MVQHNQITQQQADRRRRQQITFRPQPLRHRRRRTSCSAACATELKARFGEDALLHDGLQVTTSLDLDLQHQAEQILDANIKQYGDPANSHNGAVIVLDPTTEEILAYVGSADYFDDTIQGRVDNITAQNSPGSTLKPFTYMTAFTKGWGTGTGIIDAPLKLIDFASGQPYVPRDPISVSLGPIPVHEALGNSLNIPAVKTIEFAGVKSTEQMLRQVGYTTLHNPNGYGPALTVGGVDITLEDQSIAYSVLANGGVMRGQDIVVDPSEPGDRTLEPVSLLKVTDSTGKVLYQFKQPVERRVLPAEFPYLITSILSNGQNQCITYGVCNALVARRRPAVRREDRHERAVHRLAEPRRRHLDDGLHAEPGGRRVGGELGQHAGDRAQLHDRRAAHLERGDDRGGEGPQPAADAVHAPAGRRREGGLLALRPPPDRPLPAAQPLHEPLRRERAAVEPGQVAGAVRHRGGRT